MAQLKGTYLKLYLTNNHIAYLRSNDFNASTNMIDVTSKESLGDKEVIPGLREYTASCEGWVEQVPVNLVEQSQTFSNAAWDKTVGTTILSSNNTAPDGSNTASLVDFVKEYGVIDQDTLLQTFTTSRSTGAVLIFSVWLRSAVNAKEAVISIADNTNNVSSDETVTLSTQWQRFTVVHTFTNTSTSYDVVILGNEANQEIYVWGAQLEVGSASRTLPTTYQPTPRVNQGNLFDAIEDETSYTAKLTTGTTGEDTYSGTAYVSNLNISTPNEEAASFTCDIAFSGSITTS